MVEKCVKALWNVTHNPRSREDTEGRTRGSTIPPPLPPRQHSHRETQEVDLLSVSDSGIGHEKAGSAQICQELWVEDLEDMQNPAELWTHRLKTCPTIWDRKKRLLTFRTSSC